MKDEESLDIEQLEKYAGEYMIELANLLGSKPKSKEGTAGMVVAMANIIVMILIKICGREEAVDMAASVISHAFQQVGSSIQGKESK